MHYRHLEECLYRCVRVGVDICGQALYRLANWAEWSVDSVLSNFVVVLHPNERLSAVVAVVVEPVRNDSQCLDADNDLPFDSQ